MTVTAGSRTVRLAAIWLAALGLLLTLAQPVEAAAHRPTQPTTPIKHFVYLMQGDHTFDNYFGTYPGADGIPAKTCQVLVLTKPGNGCVRPHLLTGRAVPPLAPGRSVLDYQYADGRMNGFVAAFLRQGRDGSTAMGYYDRSNLPYYWALADRYALFDRFFSSARYGTRANRSYWVSAAPVPGGSDRVTPAGYGEQPTIFDRLQAAGVSWKFYVEGYDPKQTFRTVTANDPASQTVRVPLLNYARFIDDPALRGNIVDLSQYFRDLAAGQLPAVAYIASSGSSERSARSIPAGQRLVRTLLTQLTLSDAWSSSAFLMSYDGSGGWYDHVKPPIVSGSPAGFRVPALLVSPYTRRGTVQHTVMNSDSALRFIEQNWRLPPLNARTRSAVSLGTVFDFSSAQRPANLVTLAPPILGDRVQVTAAYLGYLGAAGFAIAIFVLAFGGPSIERHTRALRAWWAWRRPGAGPIGAGTPTTGAASLGEPAEPVKAAIARVLGRRS